MPAEPGATPRAMRGARALASRLGFRQLWQIAVAVALAATAAFGGLDAVDTKVTPIKAFEPFDDGEFTITLHRATAIDELAAIAPATPGRRYLGVSADVHNNGTIPGQLRSVVDLRGQPDKKFVGVFRIADSSLITSIGPGLTELVGFVWQLPESALQPGSTVTLRVWRKKFQELTVSYGKSWIDTDRYGEIELPVEFKT